MATRPVAGCRERPLRLGSGRSVPLSSLRSSSLTTRPPLRGVRVVSDRGTDRPAGWRGGRGGGEVASGGKGMEPVGVEAGAAVVGGAMGLSG